MNIPYVVACAENDVSFGGTDMGEHMDLTPESCQIQCRTTVGCEYWVYTTDRKTCNLKQDKTSITDITGVISGPKTCGEFLFTILLCVKYILSLWLVKCVFLNFLNTIYVYTVSFYSFKAVIVTYCTINCSLFRE